MKLIDPKVSLSLANSKPLPALTKGPFISSAACMGAVLYCGQELHLNDIAMWTGTNHVAHTDGTAHPYWRRQLHPHGQGYSVI